MSNYSSHLEIACTAIKCFNDDGTLDIDELDYLMELALRDGVIDDDERRVVNNILNEVSESDVTPEVWFEIGKLRTRYCI